MKSKLLRVVVTVVMACGFSGVVIAQPGLDGYRQAIRDNQMRTLMELQMLREAQQIHLIEQQRQSIQQQQQEEQRQLEHQRQSQRDEVLITARRSLADRAKSTCVEMILNDAGARDALTRRGITTGQLCNCVEQDLLGMVTLDLTGRILVAVNEFAGDAQRLWGSPVGREYTNRFVAALQGCSDQLGQRR